MLTLNIELEPEVFQEFDFEHSLISLSKWESKFKKPFFGRDPKTEEETIAYLFFMVVTAKPPKDLITKLSIEQVKELSEYISDSKTATTIPPDPKPRPPDREIKTSEVIYQWLVALQIPFDPVETWHLSRLFTLVQVCGIKQSDPKKMSNKERHETYESLNEKRRREMGTAG